MTTLTAADYADTGQWRLIVRIFSTGMSAYLENCLHEDVEPQELFSSVWGNGAEDVLRQIENAVYDHPRVLDDFSARIIVYDPRTLFMPTELLTETEGAEETYYTSLYETSESDIMCETDGDITAAFSLVAGLKGFLSRTFPGARIGCNLMGEVARLRKTGEGVRMHVACRTGEADFIFLDGKGLVSASTHVLTGDTDVAYHLFNIIDVYGYDPADVAVTTEGEPLSGEVTEEFSRFTRQS